MHRGQGQACFWAFHDNHLSNWSYRESSRGRAEVEKSWNMWSLRSSQPLEMFKPEKSLKQNLLSPALQPVSLRMETDLWLATLIPERQYWVLHSLLHRNLSPTIGHGRKVMNRHLQRQISGPRGKENPRHTFFLLVALENYTISVL